MKRIIMAVKFYLFKKHDVISYLQYVCVNIFPRFYSPGNVLFSVLISYYSYYSRNKMCILFYITKRKGLKILFSGNNIRVGCSFMYYLLNDFQRS